MVMNINSAGSRMHVKCKKMSKQSNYTGTIPNYVPMASTLCFAKLSVSRIWQYQHAISMHSVIDAHTHSLSRTDMYGHVFVHLLIFLSITSYMKAGNMMPQMMLFLIH